MPFRLLPLLLGLLLAAAPGLPLRAAPDPAPAAAAGPEIPIPGFGALEAALRTAKGGEIFLLAPGDYGHLMLYPARHPAHAFPETVTLRAADPDRPPRFTDGIRLLGATNIRFEGIRFDHSSPPGNSSFKAKPHLIENSRGIAFVGCVFDGDLMTKTGTAGDGFPTGYGLWTVSSGEILLENTRFRFWHRAAVFGQTRGIVVRGNDFAEMRSDGVNLVDVHDVLIEGNRFHDFRFAPGSGDHADMIQMWHGRSTDVTIRDNILDSATGNETQSIFMRNETADRGQGGREIYYRNIRIENNLIRNAHTHGITVGQTVGLVIRNNTILHNASTATGRTVYIPKINIHTDSEEVTVERNIVAHVTAAQPGWTVRDNLLAQRISPTLPNFYDRLFLDALADDPADLDKLRALPGGVVEEMQAGASFTRAAPRPAAPTARIHPETDAEAPGRIRLDGGFSAGPEGPLAAIPGARFAWDLGDGSRAEGVETVHDYAPGTWEPVLTVTLPDGREVATRSRIVVPDPRLLHVAATAEGVADLSPHRERIAGADSLTGIGPGPGERGLAFGLGPGSSLKVARRDAPQLYGLESFTVTLSLKATARRQSAGEILRLHGSIRILLTPGGDPVLAVNARDGRPFQVSARGARLTDGAWHHLSLVFDGPGGHMAIFLDGREVARGTAAGATTPKQAQDMVIGASWAPAMTGWIADLLIENRGLTAAEIAARHARRAGRP